MDYSTDAIVRMCEALADGHYRRGIRPDMRMWRSDYDELARQLRSRERVESTGVNLNEHPSKQVSAL